MINTWFEFDKETLEGVELSEIAALRVSKCYYKEDDGKDTTNWSVWYCTKTGHQWDHHISPEVKAEFTRAWRLFKDPEIPTPEVHIVRDRGPY